MFYFTAIVFILITIWIFIIIMKQNKSYTWRISIKDTCLDDVIYQECKLCFQTVEKCWVDLLKSTFIQHNKYHFYWKLKGANRYFKRYTCRVEMLEKETLLVILNEKLRITHGQCMKLTSEQKWNLSAIRLNFLNENLNFTIFCEITSEEDWC